MRFFPKTCFSVLIVATVCIIAKAILSYCYGYFGTPDSLSFFLFVFRLCWILLFIVLFSLAIASATQKQNRFIAAKSMVVFIVLNLIGNTMFEHKSLILLGMQKRLLQDHELDKLRRFCQEFDRMPELSKSDFSLSRKKYTAKDLAKAGIAPDLTFFSFSGESVVIETSNVVHISGGRPLKCINVSVAGSDLNSSNYSNVECLQISTDVILTVRTE